jgi:hypothetical protein
VKNYRNEVYARIAKIETGNWRKEGEFCMKKFAYHLWKAALVAMVVLMVLGSAGQAFGTESESQEVTLSMERLPGEQYMACQN